MSKLAEEMLRYISTRVNRADELTPEFIITVSSNRFKRYHGEKLQARKDAHYYLKLLEQNGSWIELRFARMSFGDNELLERIIIHDSKGLLEHLKIQPEHLVVKEAIDRVLDARLSLPSRFNSIEEDLNDKWGSGKTYYRCSAADASKLINSLKVIEWLEVNPDRMDEIDYRTLSVRLFCDTKLLEQLIPLVANLLKPASPTSIRDEPPNNILAYWGVSRYPHSFKFKGALQIETPKGRIDLTAVWPFIEIPPDGLKSIEIKLAPAYVLFIENKTPFERYTREIDDTGLIIYTNGFPSRQWQKIIMNIADLIDADTEFYHWGDIDRGGLEIFRFMTSLIGRDLTPHMMDQLTPSDTNEGISVNSLISILEKMSSQGALKLSSKLKTLEADVQMIDWVEQESLPIRAPNLSPNTFKLASKKTNN